MRGMTKTSCWTSGLRSRRCPASARRRRCASCREHGAFDLRNPNRVRALVASFAGGNPVRFHDASGEGYRFLADIIIALDPRNGQVAARMVAPLGQWRRYDAARQALMQQELQRILELPGLTRNTFEMASKSLARTGG